MKNDGLKYIIGGFVLLIIYSFNSGVLFTGDRDNDWVAIKDSSSPEKYRAYQKKYPNSIFEDLIKQRLWYMELEKSEKEFDTIEKCEDFIRKHGEKYEYRLLIPIIMERSDTFQFEVIARNPTIDELKLFIRKCRSRKVLARAYNLLMKMESIKLLVYQEEKDPAVLRDFVKRYKKVYEKNPREVSHEFIDAVETRIRALAESEYKQVIEEQSLEKKNSYLEKFSGIQEEKWAEGMRNKIDEEIKGMLKKELAEKDRRSLKETAVKVRDLYSKLNEKKVPVEVRKQIHELNDKAVSQEEQELVRTIENGSLERLVEVFLESGYSSSRAEDLFEKISILNSRKKIFHRCQSVNVRIPRLKSGIHMHCRAYAEAFLKDAGLVINNPYEKLTAQNYQEMNSLKADLVLQIDLEEKRISRDYVAEDGSNISVGTGVEISGSISLEYNGVTMVTKNFNSYFAPVEKLTYYTDAQGQKKAYTDYHSVFSMFEQKDSFIEALIDLVFQEFGYHPVVRSLWSIHSKVIDYSLDVLNRMSGTSFEAKKYWLFWSYMQNPVIGKLTEAIRSGLKEEKLHALNVLDCMLLKDLFCKLTRQEIAKMIIEHIDKDDRELEEAEVNLLKRLTGVDRQSAEDWEVWGRTYEMEAP